jgi:uncharacterized membrane protein YdjX (TVP38/TMEM64 family)
MPFRISGRRRVAIIIGAVLIALTVGLVVFYQLGGELVSVFLLGRSAAEIADQLRSWGTWAVAVSVLLMMAHSFVPLPSELIAIANGIVFGLVVGTAVTWVGAMFGAVLAFALARWFGRGFVETVLPARYTASIDEWTREQGTLVLLISRLLPVISFNLINYAAGLTPISWWTFLWTTGLGIVPLTFLMVFAGDEMISGRWMLALILIAACMAIVLLGYVVVKRRKSTGPS